MKQKTTGFTLIEMLAALVIAGILFAIGAPAIRGIFTSNRMATHLNTLSTAISYTRNEAVKRAAPVAVGTTGGWANDWTVWVDDGLNPGAYDAGSEALLRNGAQAGTNLTLTGTTNTIVYQPDGSIRILNAGALIVPPANITFTLCYSGQTPRILTLSTTGRPQVSTGVVVCP